MKKIILLSLCFVSVFIFLFTTTVYTQPDKTVVDADPYQLNFTSSQDNDPFFSGHIISPNSKSNIDVNTLLYPDWLSGIVNFKNGKQFRDAEIKFDLLWNRLYFKRNNTTNIFEDEVSSFYFIDSFGGINKLAGFRNGYPDFGLQTVKTFYLVLASGPRVHLLKYLRTNKGDMYKYSSAVAPTYRIAEDLFIYNVKDKSLHLISNTSVKSIEKVLYNYAPGIMQGLYMKKKKHLTIQEIGDLINQINKLSISAS